MLTTNLWPKNTPRCFLFAAFTVIACLADKEAQGQSVFTETERALIVAYWNAPDRFRESLPPEALKTGPFQMRLTPDGSRWLLAYQKAVGAAQTPPTMDAAGTAPATQEWEQWVARKVAWDRWKAQKTADALNAALKPSDDDARNRAPEAPPVPGLIPAGLLEAAGSPPAFANVVTPKQYTLSIEDDVYRFTDNVPMRPRFAYYRFPQGTVAYGTPLKEMTDTELDPLFAAAGYNPSEQRIAKAVSRLEGGFDAVNTYDTGYVSVGFIQFITGEEGKRSLSEVLLQEKSDRPEDFNRDFHRFGLDVNAAGAIVVVDPETGAELAGREAVMKIIEEKRYAAVFQRAGKRSIAFRISQIKAAKSGYWPADEPLSVIVDGRTLTGKASNVIRSEAGMATLFDRKVNRGTIAPFSDVVTKVMTAHHLTSFAEAADYEREILTALKYRTDFLNDKTLTQPK